LSSLQLQLSLSEIHSSLDISSKTSQLLGNVSQLSSPLVHSSPCSSSRGNECGVRVSPDKFSNCGPFSLFRDSLLCEGGCGGRARICLSLGTGRGRSCPLHSEVIECRTNLQSSSTVSTSDEFSCRLEGHNLGCR
jgi:hypothetical protein